MKKLLSVLLCLSMLLGCCVLSVSAQEETLNLILATDIHLEDESFNDTAEKRNNVNKAYFHISSSGMLYDESLAIFTQFLKRAATADGETVLIAGDLVDDGKESEHLFMIDKLEEFERTTGKQVYVIPGNHDLIKTSLETFKTYYAEFGYNEAIAKDTLSGSYVVELSDGYRLLAIDSTVPGEGQSGIDAPRAEWIRQQCEKAQKDGKKLIAMMHHTLLSHIKPLELFHKGSMIDKNVGLPEIFAKYGVKYIFTGHMHENDILAYSGAQGETIYDVLTGALISYPCAYREVSFGDEVVFDMKYIDSVDINLIPENISDEARELLVSDFTAYSKKCVMEGVQINLGSSFLKPKTIKRLLNVNDTDHPEICALIDEVMTKVNKVAKMPFSSEDETVKGESIESILAPYGISISDTDYANVVELIVSLYEEHVAGDENKHAYDEDVVLTSRGVAAMLIYALSDVTAEEYSTVIEFLCELLDIPVPTDLINSAGDGISRFEGIEIIVSTAIVPLILSVTEDSAPGDCDVTLPGYAELVEPEIELSFWEKIQNFFIRIFSFVMSLFAFI